MIESEEGLVFGVSVYHAINHRVYGTVVLEYKYSIMSSDVRLVRGADERCAVVRLCFCTVHVPRPSP